MTINRRIRQRGINVALIAFVYLVTGIFCAAQAKSFTPKEKDKVLQVAGTNKNIHHVLNANLNVKAVQLKSKKGQYGIDL